MYGHEKIETTLYNVQEFESFVYELFDRLPTDELKHGESLIPYIEKCRIQVPDFLRSTEMKWEKDAPSEKEGDIGRPLVLTRPGQSQILGSWAGCVRIGRYTVCVGCWWFICVIIIYTRRAVAS
ncbi:MAG: hypothetical protein ACJ76Y_12370 [Thermoanaerobaculia bacterium]